MSGVRITIDGLASVLVPMLQRGNPYKKGGSGILPLASRGWKPLPHFLNIQAWDRKKTLYALDLFRAFLISCFRDRFLSHLIDHIIHEERL